MSDEVIIKLNSVGAFQVGKTSLIRRYAENQFTEDYLPTLGVDITVKRLTLERERVRLVLMDTAGEEKFGRLRQTYFTGSLGCIAVYDITRRDSLNDLDRWISEYRKVAGINAFVSIVGNKIDLADHRAIPTVEGQKWASSRGFPFYESSAKFGGEVISRIYIDLVRKCLAMIKP